MRILGLDLGLRASQTRVGQPLPDSVSPSERWKRPVFLIKFRGGTVPGTRTLASKDWVGLTLEASPKPRQTPLQRRAPLPNGAWTTSQNHGRSSGRTLKQDPPLTLKTPQDTAGNNKHGIQNQHTKNQWHFYTLTMNNPKRENF